MPDRIVPMIHVPDVRATVDWYVDIGFKIIDTYDDGRDGLSFAILEFGNSEVMFNQGGQPSAVIAAKLIFTFTPKILMKFSIV
jgi:catechol 2,3-dioxygenase-like lactoylglutathione lyase family enzyme